MPNTRQVVVLVGLHLADQVAQLAEFVRGVAGCRVGELPGLAGGLRTEAQLLAGNLHRALVVGVAVRLLGRHLAARGVQLPDGTDRLGDTPAPRRTHRCPSKVRGNRASDAPPVATRGQDSTRSAARRTAFRASRRFVEVASPPEGALNVAVEGVYGRPRARCRCPNAYPEGTF